MMVLTISPNLTFKLPFIQQPKILHRPLELNNNNTFPSTSSSFLHSNPKLRSARRLVLNCVCSDNGEGGTLDATSQHPDPSSSSSSDAGAFKSSLPSSIDGYIALLTRMLGIDNDPLDREEAVIALWKYSQGGKHCIDGIMQFRGCISLIVNLLRSDSSSTCEAAAGLLGTISSLNLYRDSVAESGAIEEITGLLTRSSLTAEVKEQMLCVLWNLSVDEKPRTKIANSDLLPAVVKALDDEKIKVKEAAGGVLANLALSHSNHQIMVEAGAIPKLAKFLKSDAEESKVIRKEAKTALLEFAKDEYHRILIIEEGLVLVPLVGKDAYRCFKAVSNSRPTLPDGIEFERSSSTASISGASEMLLGLNPVKNLDLDEAKISAMVGRAQQQFLACIGTIEMEDEKKPHSESLTNMRNTLLPSIDGVARLVLILELEDVSAISRAAWSIGDASINEHMRMSFMTAGAVKHLVRLLSHNNENVRLAVSHAIERLSLSNNVCHIIEAEGAVYPLANALKNTEMPANQMEKTMDILARILDPGKEMKLKFYDGPANGSEKALNGTRSSNLIKGSAGKPDDSNISKLTIRDNVLDTCVISRLVEIMKTSSTDLQRKACSILEYVAIIEPCMEKITAMDIESGLDAVFQQRFLNDKEDDIESQRPELTILEAEEAGLAISAASRLFTKLLDSDQFHRTLNSSHFMKVLRKVLKSDIPLQHKEWVAACLVKLQSSSGSPVELGDPIDIEVTLYETIPRLIEQIKNTFASEVQEAAVIELNAILSNGVVDYSRAVAAHGGIFPLVKVVEEGSKRAVESSLAILFNLSMDNENHSAIIAAGAVPALRRIVLSQGPQWSRALHLLRTLPTS